MLVIYFAHVHIQANKQKLDVNVHKCNNSECRTRHPRASQRHLPFSLSFPPPLLPSSAPSRSLAPPVPRPARLARDYANKPLIACAASYADRTHVRTRMNALARTHTDLFTSTPPSASWARPDASTGLPRARQYPPGIVGLPGHRLITPAYD